MSEKGINKKELRVGELGYNSNNELMKIIEYNNVHNIMIEFQDEHKAKVNTSYNAFKNGNVKNPYHLSVCGVGYYGQGKYKARGKNGKHTECYKTWKNMIHRCYDPYYLNKYPTYIDCYVCNEWHNFQNFAKWYEENYYEVDGEIMHLDKDILFKGNKVYSSGACLIVPERINLLFVKSNKQRGKYPIGISYDKINDKLRVDCHVYENEKRKTKFLGRFPINDLHIAFNCYKNFKENYIKQIANEYKNLIPHKLYEAMYNYKVEIND